MDAEHAKAKKLVLSLVAALLLAVPIHAQTLSASAGQVIIGQVLGCNDAQVVSLKSSSSQITLTATVTYPAADVHDGWVFVRDLSTGNSTNGTSGPITITVPSGSGTNLRIGLNSQIGGDNEATVTLTTASPAGQVLTIPVKFSMNTGCGTVFADNGAVRVENASMTLTASQGLSQTQYLRLKNVTMNQITVALQRKIPFAPWLSIGLSTVNIPGDQLVAVSVTATATTTMPVGTYTSTIVVSTPPAGFPNGSEMEIAITFIVTSSGAGSFCCVAGLNPGTNALYFSYAPGAPLQALPLSQTLHITNQIATAPGPTVFGVSITTYNGVKGWLTTNFVDGGQTPYDLVVSVNPAGLQPGGTYQGSITLTPVGGPSVSLYVALTISQVPVITASPSSLTFTYVPGGAKPANQQIQVSGGGRVASFVSESMSGGWLNVAPALSLTPAGGTQGLIVSVDPTNLKPGTYKGVITVYGNGPAVGTAIIDVFLTVTEPAVTQVANAASYLTGAVAPGEIVTLFADSSNAIGPEAGVLLTGDLIVDGQLPTTMGGVRVFFSRGGATPSRVAAPLIYVSATQVNCVVPYEVEGAAEVRVEVEYQGRSSDSFTLDAAATQPGIFTATAMGIGQAAIGQYDELGTYLGANSIDRPVTRGNIITLYVTGEGRPKGSVSTGRITSAQAAAPYTPQPQYVPSVLIDGQPATITFYGAAPGFVAGLMQVNVIVPRNIRPGPNVPVSITIGPNYSQAGVTIAAK